MTIKEMNDAIKKMRKVCDFKDGETDIAVRSSKSEPAFVDSDAIRVETVIDGINVEMYWNKSRVENYGKSNKQ